ncbi:MAG: hypothetical protein AAFU41_18765 [Pseudomonadota bacterium]
MSISPETVRLYVYGTREISTGAINLTDTKTLFVDPDGDDNGGRGIEYSDGNGNFVTFNPTLFGESDEYEFARHFSIDFGDTFGFVILGTTTSAEDVPSVGTTTYLGDTLVLDDPLVGGRSAFRGIASLDADFDNGLVDAMLGTGRPDTLTDIQVEDMIISGNSFAGGNITLLENGMDVTDTYIGGSLGSDAAGLFFGPIEQTNILSNFDGPGEIGGMAVINGNTRLIEAYFLADIQ